MDGKRLLAFVLVVLITFGIIGTTSPWLVKHIRLGLDLKGGFEILYVATPVEAGQVVTKELLNRTAESIAQRANKSGVAEPDITTEGKDRIRVRLAGVANQEELRKVLAEPAQLTFRSGPPDYKTVEMNGTDFVEGGASVQFDSQTNQPVVQIKVKDASKFQELTKRLTGQPLAIYLDEQQLSAPIVQGEIGGGVATITGSKTLQEANDTRDTINLGALPLKLTEKYSQSVGASLGQQSLKDTGIASAIASVLILLFMLIVYRVPGIVACISLITFTWMLMAVTVLMNATLTLPGIAAFVLSVGIAVDSNIIMDERVKEEIRHGKSVLSSLKSGTKHSFRTIIDAHVTTFLAGAVLYFLGTGAIKGFALTLMFSIIVNIITNVFYSKWLLRMLIRSNLVKKPAYFGVKESDIHGL